MKIFVSFLLTVPITLTFLYCNQQPTTALNDKPAISQDSLIKRGHYLVTIMACNDCHSPKVFGPQGPMPDTTRLLSGHPADMPVSKYDTGTAKNWILFNMFNTAIVGPWGTSFAANLTSDSTGIGSWTEQQFFKAMREGKYKGLDGERMLLPPMPWPSYVHATDEDLRAIFSYLKSTRPIKNVVPEPIPPGR